MLAIQLLLIQIFCCRKQMRPSRPDSAKSARTKITVDSQALSQDIEKSKFSETYAFGTAGENRRDFHAYVDEKNKDPKYRKLVDSKLPDIPEHTQQSKMPSKPFDRKGSRLKQAKKDVKVEQRKQMPLNTKRKETTTNAKPFPDKNKSKVSQTKVPADKVQNQQNNEATPKTRISFDGFTISEPGKPKRLVQESQRTTNNKQASKEQEEQKQREKQLLELSSFIEQVENRNLDYYPTSYDMFVKKNESCINREEIEKIDIADYLDEPSERDYEYLRRRISENEKQLNGGDRDGLSASKNTVTLSQDGSIGASDHDDDDQDIEPIDNGSVVLSSMTASEMRDRNMFITQIFKKQRISGQQLRQVQESDLMRAKLKRLEHETQNQQFDDLEVEMTEVNLMKKKNTRIMERNRIEAAGQLYQECDYLSSQERKRIEDLINGGVEIQSPFSYDQMEQMRNRRIDEGINIHRGIVQGSGEGLVEDQPIVDSNTLPRDPLLRKEAELKILRQKIGSVNNRLRSVDEVVVNRSKIDNLIERMRERTLISETGRSIIEERSKEDEQQQFKLREAKQLIEKTQKQRHEIDQVLQDWDEEFRKAQQQVESIRRMDVEQRRQLQIKELQAKKKSVQEIQQQALLFQQQIDQFEAIGQQLQRNLQALAQIAHFDTEKFECQNYHEHETIEELNQIITSKWQQGAHQHGPHSVNHC